MKVVDSARMAEIDRRTQEEYGFPGIVLMENAGLKSYQFLNAATGTMLFQRASPPSLSARGTTAEMRW